MKSKPFLRWAGSKRKLLSKLIPYWGQGYDRYVEPFMGSACLFFAISPNKALLNDINRDLINTYEAVKNSPKELHKQLLDLPLGKEAYYKIRAIDISEISDLDKAARFIYLNRQCFNGLYRTNKAGKFNVPFSPDYLGKLPSLSDLTEASNLLRSKDLRSKDFESLLEEEVKYGDFVYLDPPYAVKNSKIFTQYDAQSFGINDIERLLSCVVNLDKNKIKFVLSYANCEEIIELFGSWNIIEVSAYRNIAGFAKHRGDSKELIISNIQISEI